MTGRKSLFAIGFLLVFAATSRGEVFTHITGEGGRVEYDHRKDQGNGWYSEAGSDYRYKLGFKQGERDSAAPILVATLQPTEAEKYRGNASLELKIIANQEKKSLRAAYKVDISSVKPGDAFSPPIKSPKDWFHSFALKIDAAEYRLPTGKGMELIFAQWWQGSPFHPPVSLAIFNEEDARAQGWADANPDGNFALVLRDDDHDPISMGRGEARRYNLGPVEKAEWLRWCIRVRPDPTGKDGAVSVFFNGAEKLKLERIVVGYDPARYAAKPRPANSFAYVGCCLYRLNGLSAQRFWFDEIKFSDSLEDALRP
jgi:hypothetical protein